jgi:hypothetical protein
MRRIWRRARFHSHREHPRVVFPLRDRARFRPRPWIVDLLGPQLVADRRWLLVLRPQSLQSLTLEDPQSWVRNHLKELVGGTDPTMYRMNALAIF